MPSGKAYHKRPEIWARPISSHYLIEKVQGNHYELTSLAYAQDCTSHRSLLEGNASRAALRVES